jgi:hypothetical protein
MTDGQRMSIGKLILYIVLFVIVGTPIVAYLWDSLNLFFAGYVEAVRLVLALISLAAFLALAWFIARQVRRWEADQP